MNGHRNRISTAVWVLMAIFVLAACVTPVSAAKFKDPRKLKYPPLGEIQTPDITREVLDNGMVIYLLEDHDFPLVDYSMTIRVGSVYEPEPLRGLAGITGTVMRTGGSATIAGDDLDELLEASGAVLESNIGNDSGTITGSFLSEKAIDGLKLLADLAFNPAFPDEKIELAKVSVRTAIASRNDEFINIAIREFRKLMYGEHSPYGWYPEYETVAAISRENLIAFHQTFFHPDRMILTVCGDFNKAEMLREIESIFGARPKAPAPLPPKPPLPSSAPSGTYFAQKDNITNSAVLFGLPGHLVSDPDYAALQLLNTILGDGFSSRLINEIRTKRGLAYTVGSGSGSGWDHPGTWICYLMVQADSTLASKEGMLDEVKRIVTEEVSEVELQRAKDYILNGLVFRLAAKRNVMNRQAFYEYNGYPANFLETYQTQIPALTPADLLEAASRHIIPDNICRIIVGDAGEFSQPLSNLGDYTELDVTIPDPPSTFEAPPLTEESADAGKAILTSAYNAHGGSAINAVKTILHEGNGKRAMMGQEMSFSLLSQKIMPDRTHSEINFGFFAITHVADGDGGWIQTPQGVMDRPAEEIAQAAEEEASSFFHFFKHWQDYTWQALEQVEIDGVLCDAVYPHDVPLTEWLVYFDAETHLLKAMDFRTRGPEGPVKARELYGDYRDVSGVQINFSNKTLYDGEENSSIAFSRIEAGIEIDESMFTKPE